MIKILFGGFFYLFKCQSVDKNVRNKGKKMFANMETVFIFAHRNTEFTSFSSVRGDTQAANEGRL